MAKICDQPEFASTPEPITVNWHKKRNVASGDDENDQMEEESKESHHQKDFGPTSAEIAAILSEFNLLNNADDQMQQESSPKETIA